MADRSPDNHLALAGRPAHLKQEASFHSSSSSPQLVSDQSLTTFDAPPIEQQFTDQAFESDLALNGPGGQDDQFFGLGSSLDQDNNATDAYQYADFSAGMDASGMQDFGMGDSTALGYTDGQALNPAFLTNNQNLQSNSLDPNGLSLENILDMQQLSHDPQHRLQSNSNLSSQSPSLSSHQSPSPANSAHGQPLRPRNVSQSLDPSSAAFPQGYPAGLSWGAGQPFEGHRRKPSDTLSEYSSHSNQASPYMGQSDTFDQGFNASPSLNAQGDMNLFGDSLGLSQFTISDNQLINAGAYSPAQSIQGSPLINSTAFNPSNQQALPPFTSTDNFGLTPDLQMGVNQQQSNDFDQYTNIDPFGQYAFPTLDSNINTHEGLEGQADVMSPPEINIDFAPPSRQPSFGPGRGRPRAGSSNELLPPDNSRKNRHRAKSDPFHSRPTSPAINRGRSPSLQPELTPAAVVPLPSSRSPSPGGVRNRSQSSASDSRRYLLDLADPERAAGGGNDHKRQKHPATFHCHLCPKKFTRAYNLRSHLRTHTDERPFKCNYCDKAFARQHDRKRHEGLHSGEKKFVCKGDLKNDTTWGCGRKFARADALGRHFRSEAGRECIKPLLDEEKAERQRTWMEEQQQQRLQEQQGFVAPSPMTEQPQLATQLPAALLAMYPDLVNFDFGAVAGPSGAAADDDYVTGRSSFDASSGGESYFSDSDMYDLPMEGQGQGFGDVQLEWQQQQRQ